MRDPIGFLDKAGVDWEIQRAVVMRARDIEQKARGEELAALAKGIGSEVGNRVAQVIGQMFR